MLQMPRRPRPILLAAVLCVTSPVLAEPPTDAPKKPPAPPPAAPRAAPGAPAEQGGGEEAAVRKAADAYLEAFRKGDAEAVAAMWAPDADYVREGGETVKGREAIAALFRESFKALKDHEVRVPSRTVRLLRPDVAIEDGSFEVVPPKGEPVRGRFTAVWTKADGKWLINSVRDLGDDTPREKGRTPGQRALAGLEWMVGEWVDAEDDRDVEITVKWAENRSFLLKEFRIRRAGGEAFTVTQRIGWDAAAGRLRA
jgi:uncharacterized protein (TIGR02246 family)